MPQGPCAARRPLTARDLATHTAGVAYGPLLGRNRVFSRWGAACNTNASLAAVFGAHPLAFQPGKRFVYGPSHVLLGHALTPRRSVAPFPTRAHARSPGQSRSLPAP